MAEMKNLKVEVVRYNPEVDTAPHSAFYDVPYDEQTSLLDALGYIKDNLAPDLSYRWSCRMAICGSCGMMVNKVPKLACKTFLRDYTKGIKVEALANFPIERDLVVDMTHFIESLEAIKPYIIGNNRTPDQGPNKQTPAQMAKYHQFSGCINCGLCYAACPQFGLNPEFIGPAAITLAHRYNEDSRDHGKKERMAQQRPEWRLDLYFRGLLLGSVSEARRPGGRDPAGQGGKLERLSYRHPETTLRSAL